MRRPRSSSLILRSPACRSKRSTSLKFALQSMRCVLQPFCCRRHSPISPSPERRSRWCTSQSFELRSMRPVRSSASMPSPTPIRRSPPVSLPSKPRICRSCGTELSETSHCRFSLRRRYWVMLRRLFLALLVSASAEAFAASQGGPIPVPLPLFPANNWWNTDVSHAPLDPSSATFIAFINAGPCPPNPYPPCKLHPDWGGDNGDGTTYGFPFIQVDGSQPLKTVIFDNPAESDGVDHNTETSFPFYPIPDEAITTFAWIEGGPPGNVPPDGDRHMLIVDTTHNTLFELYHVY